MTTKTAKRMSQATAKTLCTALGCTFNYDSEYREFRVNFKGGNLGTLYHTDDIYDAVETAVTMHHMRCTVTPEPTPATPSAPTTFYLTVGTRTDNLHLVSLWDDPASRQRGLDDGDRLVDLELTSAQRSQLFGN